MGFLFISLSFGVRYSPMLRLFRTNIESIDKWCVRVPVRRLVAKPPPTAECAGYSEQLIIGSDYILLVYPLVFSWPRVCFLSSITRYMRLEGAWQ